ncbi:uncharacterized protein I206_102175 [Kwoniella pini CBS 10737]|uniref:Uncharacterized protein n=1 Tax=Kwoniella pini CBS 10737 TaxID=1296096 RepID=A0AAJ8L348_9TREE
MQLILLKGSMLLSQSLISTQFNITLWMSTLPISSYLAKVVSGILPSKSPIRNSSDRFGIVTRLSADLRKSDHAPVMVHKKITNRTSTVASNITFTSLY